MMTVPIRIKRLEPSAQLPQYATEGSAGLDFAAAREAHVGPGCTEMIGTGLAIELPPGYALFVLPRSGLAAKHSVTVLNAPGLVDSDYRNEVCVLLHNHGDHPLHVREGDRIAQFVVLPVPRVHLQLCDELNLTDRVGGFGSTGR